MHMTLICDFELFVIKKVTNSGREHWKLHSLNAFLCMNVYVYILLFCSHTPAPVSTWAQLCLMSFPPKVETTSSHCWCLVRRWQEHSLQHHPVLYQGVTPC